MFFKKKDFGSSVDYIIAGLGNPGSQYDLTRHNAGFMAVDKIAEEYKVKVDRIKFKSLCNTFEMKGKKVLLMKPQTFMNLSGQSITEAMNFYKVPIENVIILCDDISLEPSKLRIRRKGSDGGHNGLKNIIYLSGKDTFPRIRIGVGQKPHPDYDLADWVLSRFTQNEQKLMAEGVEKAMRSCELMVQGNIDQAMNKYNS